MDLTRLALKNRTVTVVTVVLLMLGGLISYFTMPQDEDPGFTIRVANVVTIFPGASPERVRDLVTRPLEAAISEMSEIKVLTSASRQGVSSIGVEINFEHNDLQPIWDELNKLVAEATDDLPDGVIGPRVEDDFGDVFSVLLAITGEGYTIEELGTVAEEVRTEILGIPDVARVEVYGVPDREAVIAYDRARLQNLGLTPYTVAGAIQRTNVVRPAGSLNIGANEIPVESSGNFLSLEALQETLIPLPDSGQLIPVRDFAEVSIENEDPLPSIVRYNGRDAVVLGINMREGGRITVMGDQIRALAAALEPRFPIGVEFDFVAFQPDIVSNLVDSFSSNVVQAILIVIGVMFLAAGLRSGLVVAALIPTSMIGSLLVMNLFGITINQMSLAALIIVLGMLVDSAIVFNESMVLELSHGKSPDDAAMHVSRELRVPLLTSALTTAAAFLPIALAQSNAGEYTRPLFYVVTIALLLAWVLTITVIPLLASRLLPGYVERRQRQARERGRTSEALDNRLNRAYIRILAWILGHRAVSVLGIIAMLVGALALFRTVPASFFPETSYPIFTLEVSLPRGTAIEETARLTDQIELLLEDDLDEVVVFHSAFIGGGVPRYRLNVSPQDSRPEYVFFLANATETDRLPEIFEFLRTSITDLAPDASIRLSPFSFGPAASAPLEIRLSGPDRDRLYTHVGAVKARLSEIEGVTNVRDDWGIRGKTLNVTIDEASARRLGITNQDVATSLQLASVGVEISEYRGDVETMPIMLRDSGVRRTSVEELESTTVYSEAGGPSVPLRQVADVELAWQPSVINQRDGVEVIMVQADTVGAVNAITITDQLRPWLAEQASSWPVGFNYEFGGELEGSGDANAAIVAQLPLVLFIITFLLVMQFNSLRAPLIILTTIPFGFIGVSVGLFVLQESFSFMALLGLVSLSGVVLNDSIVLLEKIKLERDEGRSINLSIVRAALRKIRPIILTSVTTIAGLLPLLLFGGPLWEPMAAGLMFGLAFATVLTLALIPVLYSLFFGGGRMVIQPAMEELT